MHNANNDENLQVLQFDAGGGSETRQPIGVALCRTFNNGSLEVKQKVANCITLANTWILVIVEKEI